MMKKMVGLIMVFLLSSVGSMAWGEQFHLKNGDVISGELSSCEEGTYRLTSKYGIVSILSADMAFANFNAEGGVVTVITGMKPDENSPDQIRGAVKTIQNGTILIQTEYGEVTINALDKLKYLAANQDALQQAENVVKTATGQEFRLKSGETVSGEVVSYAEGVYRVRSKYGVLSINGEDVASVLCNAKGGIVTVFTAVAPTAKESDVLRGTVDSFRNGGLKIVTEYGYVVVDKLEKLKQIDSSDSSESILGEWHGKIGISDVTLVLAIGKQLSGTITYNDVEEKLIGELKDGRQIVLKGVSYRRLSGGNGYFNLDTLYGTLSPDGRSIKGNYEDAGGGKGEWFVSKTPER